MNQELLEQRVTQLEEKQKELTDDVKELNTRLNRHDTTAAKIELIIEGMKADWLELKADIQKMIDRQNEKEQTNYVNVFKEIILELIKAVGLIVAAFLAAKSFFG